MRDDTVYRGYMIRTNLAHQVWVEKEHYLICWATSVEDARRKIDEMLA